MKLTQEQLKNLGLFLGRIQLSGNEVPAFNDLVAALNRPDEEAVKVEVKEDKVKK